jgi:hypothetical protein
MAPDALTSKGGLILAHSEKRSLSSSSCSSPKLWATWPLKLAAICQLSKYALILTLLLWALPQPTNAATVIMGNLTGTTNIIIKPGDTLEITGSVDITASVSFSGSNSQLHLDSPTTFLGYIHHFGQADEIDLRGVNPKRLTEKEVG